MKTIFKRIINHIIPEKDQRMILWKLFNIKINRNQWEKNNKDLWSDYRVLMGLSWEETVLKHPEYSRRVSFTVKHSRGRVLEIGCGIGNITRWISTNDQVTQIAAIDLFEEAVAELKALKIPKVEAAVMGAQNIYFPEGTFFDTVVLNEILEHIYPDEEAQMLACLKPYLARNSHFIISTPIGWMPDPYHTRGFSGGELIRHIGKYYGSVREIDTSAGYSQSILGQFNLSL